MLRNTALESAAAHGSTSYGPLTPVRLHAVLRGSQPSRTELAAVYQALSETPLHRLATLAREIDLPFDALDERFTALFGKTLREAQQWNLGGH
ncbi:hypothetical protein [Mesorhizobium sp. CN2-181]|uniref:hypothetical protein n=1 Tax=Mesorhizobium yinganensis TaxID=3157707 RepID=UPI0032B81C4D